MIAAPAGAYFVSQERTRPDGKLWSRHYPVVAFDDDGWPLIFVDGERSMLERPSFDSWTLNSSDMFPIAPADGWFGVFKQQGGTIYQRVAFWGFDGKGEPSGFEAVEGELEPMNDNANLIGYEHRDDISDAADPQATIERAKRNLAAASEAFEQNIRDPEALASIQASLATIRQVLAVFGPPPPRP